MMTYEYGLKRAGYKTISCEYTDDEPLKRFFHKFGRLNGNQFELKHYLL